MSLSPCKMCEKREVGCHAKCEDYKKYVAESKKEKNSVKANEVDIYVAELIRRSKRGRPRR